MLERERRPKAPHNDHTREASARPGQGGICYRRLRGFTLDEARRILTPGLQQVHVVSKLGQTVDEAAVTLNLTVPAVLNMSRRALRRLEEARRS